MNKAKKIAYWIFTLWLVLGAVSTGIVQVMKIKSETDYILELGYPAYILTLLGVWKLVGAVAILIPGFPVIKEWAYAGFFFTMTGALYSHLAAGSGAGKLFPPILFLALIALSWILRPAERRCTR